MKETDPYLAKFDELIAPTAGRHPSWVFPLRKAGIARFAELGFPTLKDEDWRFTNVAPIAKLPFKPVFGANTDGVAAKAPGKFTFADLNGPRLVFVDGHFADLYPKQGQPACPPWRLALITLMQFREGLSDRQAAEAVRARIDEAAAMKGAMSFMGAAGQRLEEDHLLDIPGRPQHFPGLEVFPFLQQEWRRRDGKVSVHP